MNQTARIISHMDTNTTSSNTSLAKTEQMQSLDNLAYWLDSSIRIPGTQWRIGFDGIIGLIPGVGDVIAGGLSTYVIAQAAKMKMPISVIARMILNVLFEMLVGAIPLIGDWFDFAFKANRRNVKLMQNYLDNEKGVTNTSRLRVFLVVITAIALLIFCFWIVFKLIALIFSALF